MTDATENSVALTSDSPMIVQPWMPCNMLPIRFGRIMCSFWGWMDGADSLTLLMISSQEYLTPSSNGQEVLVKTLSLCNRDCRTAGILLHGVVVMDKLLLLMWCRFSDYAGIVNLTYPLLFAQGLLQLVGNVLEVNLGIRIPYENMPTVSPTLEILSLLRGIHGSVGFMVGVATH